jgi:hypothetical protein
MTTPLVMRSLREDHRNLAKLLDLLEREVKRFDEAGAVDYELMQSIVAYCLDYPDKVHHPREDRLLERLREPIRRLPPRSGTWRPSTRPWPNSPPVSPGRSTMRCWKSRFRGRSSTGLRASSLRPIAAIWRLITSLPNVSLVERARDAGAHAVLAKPMSLKSLYSRITMILQERRPFIETDEYFGPDRRRRDLLFDGPNRRKGGGARSGSGLGEGLVDTPAPERAAGDAV